MLDINIYCRGPWRQWEHY